MVTLTRGYTIPFSHLLNKVNDGLYKSLLMDIKILKNDEVEFIIEIVANCFNWDKDMVYLHYSNSTLVKMTEVEVVFCEHIQRDIKNGENLKFTPLSSINIPNIGLVNTDYRIFHFE